MPCIDQMTSKTYYTTTIVADSRYTNIVTNGDLAPGYFHASTGEPVYHTPEEALGSEMNAEISINRPEGPSAPKHVLKYYNHKVNMAPYLFFLGVGTYDVYQRRLEYPDGAEIVLEVFCLM